MGLTDRIENDESLDEFLTRPSERLVGFIRTLSSPLLVMGAGGKMGPSLAVLAKRAAEASGHPLEVIAISRFSDLRARDWLENHRVKTISCDLLNSGALQALPNSSNIIYLVGLKFGTGENPGATWVMNTIVPARVLERYPGVRIAALSTGNVYPPSLASAQGSRETARLTPLGEYPNAAVARERIFEYYSKVHQTPVALLRLFYAVELRYGVLTDIARSVYADRPIILDNGAFNCIWQGDANEMILRSLALAAAPPVAWNLCRPEICSVRATAMRCGELLGKEPRFVGAEQETALLGDSSALCLELGRPPTSVESMLRWITHWVKKGGRDLARPTHFEVRDGNY